MVPLLAVLYSLLIGIILFVVFRYIMNLTDRLSQVSAIFASCLICIYLIIVTEFQNFLMKK